VLVSGPPSDTELAEAVGGRRVVARAPYRHATSAPLDEVVLEGDERLILKSLARERLLDKARASKPEHLHDPRREIDTYRAILTPAGIGPRCLATGEDWLLIEKVPGVELWQIGEFAVWEATARWLGDFHARFAGRLDELRAANPHLLEQDPAWFRAWAERASGALSRSSDPRAPALVAALERYDGEAAAALPPAFIHGELYPSNVLVVVRGDDVDVRPIDWEMAGTGPALIDLAALSGGWSPEERARLERAYLAGRGEGTTDGLAWCRLALALQWLGWAHDWRPPRAHRHDWLDEALDLAEEVGLR
jgi:aminoglycoside phosphotransferase (APT) family kinase protein